MPKLCRVPTCPTPIPFAMVMCGRHWYMLPIALRRQINKMLLDNHNHPSETLKEWQDAIAQALSRVSMYERSKSTRG